MRATLDRPATARQAAYAGRLRWGSYRLAASFPNLPTAESVSFDVFGSQLRFLSQPHDVLAGQPQPSPIRVARVDDTGAIDPSSGFFPYNGMALGVAVCPEALNLSAATVDGIAEFDNVVLTRACPVQTLVAFAGGGTPEERSAFFVVSPLPAAALAFRGGLDSPGRLIPSDGLRVALVDIYNNQVSTPDVAVTVSLDPSPNNATMSGTLTRTSLAGQASFPGLSIDLSGTYTITASAAGYPSISTSPFEITPWAQVYRGLATVPPWVVDPLDPAHLYTAGGDYYGGIGVSTDHGRTWGRLFTGISQPVRSVAIDPSDPQVLYAAVYDVVRKSTDGGLTWSTVFSGALGGSQVIVDPVTPTTVYVAGVGVGKSVDGGATWSGDLLAHGYVVKLALDPTSPSTLFASTQHEGVFRSFDGGLTWTSVSAGLPDVPYDLVVDPFDSQTWYALFSRAPLHVTHDTGQTWNSIDSTLGFGYDLVADPSRQGRFVLCGPGGAVQTFDGFTTWGAFLPTSLQRFAVWLRFAPSNPEVAYVGASQLGAWLSVTSGL